MVRGLAVIADPAHRVERQDKMEELSTMSNGQLLALLEAISILAEKSTDVSEFQSYIQRLKNEIKKPNGSTTTDPLG